jgi:hypothetical protein
MISPQVKERIGSGLAALAFLFVFGGVGFGAFYVIGATIRDGLRAQDWVRTKAQVNHVDQGSVTYTYEWQGKRYTGDRAGTFILGGTSDVDDWDDRMEAAIRNAQQEEKPFMVFVNPEKPSESMANNEIRWKLLLIALPFGLGFGGAGLAAFFLIGRDALGFKESGAGVPWLKPKTREALFQWVVAIVWNGVSLPIALVAIPSLWTQGEWIPIAMLAFFPLFGMLILWSALSSSVAACREGIFNRDWRAA